MLLSLKNPRPIHRKRAVDGWPLRQGGFGRMALSFGCLVASGPASTFVWPENVALARGPLRAPAATCQVSPSENVQVTHSTGRSWMFEPVVAVDPHDPRRLALGATVRQREGGPSSDVMPFASTDGGRTWHDGLRPGPARNYNADTGMILTLDGRAILSAYHGTHNILSTSDRALRRWDDARLPIPRMDKPTLAQDQTRGPFRGRYYLFGMSGERGADRSLPILYRLRLAHSSDLHSWTDRTVTTSTVTDAIYTPAHPRFLNTTTDLLISRTGSIFLTFLTGSIEGETQAHMFARSSDGGDTFTAPRIISREDGTRLFSVHANAWPSFAIDAGESRYRDRLYALWFEAEPGSASARLLFSHSRDMGATWAAPRLIETIDNPGQILQPGTSTYFVLPSIQVNHRGIVMLTWYRLRQAGPIVQGQNVPVASQRWVTASVDGGTTFLPTRPLASQESTLHYMAGDYVKLVADRAGIFH